MIPQSKFLQNLVPVLKSSEKIKAAFVYGSYARGDANAQSDLDVAVWTTPDFDAHAATASWRKTLDAFGVVVAQKNKIALYADNLRTEIAYSSKIDDFAREFVGSEIPRPETTVLFDVTGDVLPFLLSLSPDSRMNGKAEEIIEAVHKFLYNFECASSYHRRSDAYKFYYTYNIALGEAVRLFYWAQGHRKFSYLPKRLNVLYPPAELQRFYGLNGTLYLRDANEKKRRLLDYFYDAIERLPAVTPQWRDEIRQFCETVFRRDYFWNLRDVSAFNPRIRPQTVFRSAALCAYEHQPAFDELVQNVKIFIDLRADYEIEKEPYSPSTLQKIQWVRCPIDPLRQSEHFKTHEQYGTNSEIAYRFFALECQEPLARAMRTIAAAPEPTLVHCAAGKDRTGCVVTLLHLLSGAPDEIVYADYAASEMDVALETLNEFLRIVNDKGGVVEYMKFLGLNDSEIIQLKHKMSANRQ